MELNVAWKNVFCSDVGIKWNNFYEPLCYYDNFSLLDAMAMLLIDTCLHLLVTWYVDNVMPGEFGVPKPFYFFIMVR